MDEQVTVNIGGELFYTYKSTLLKAQYFAPFFNWQQSTETKVPFIDRNPQVFHHVLSLLRDSNYPFPLQHKNELDFFGIDYDEDQLFVPVTQECLVNLINEVQLLKSKVDTHLETLQADTANNNQVLEQFSTQLRINAKKLERVEDQNATWIDNLTNIQTQVAEIKRTVYKNNNNSVQYSSDGYAYDSSQIIGSHNRLPTSHDTTYTNYRPSRRLTFK